MDTTIIRKIESELQQKRFKANMDCALRLDGLYKKHPELLELEAQRRSFVSDFSLDKNERQRRAEEVKKKIDLYIAKNAIIMPKPEYSCSLCKDTGYVTENGREERCACFNRRIIEEAMTETVFSADETFENFDEAVFAPEYRKEMCDIRDYCEAYCESFPKIKRPNLMLCGDTGTGKTFLLSCIYARLKARGFAVVYITAGRLFDVLRKYAFNKVNDIDALLDAEMLIIDDLGTEPMFNNITVEYIFFLVNERTRQKKPMCISTNLTPDELKAKYTERVTSRLFDKTISSVFRLTGDDLRLKR